MKLLITGSSGFLGVHAAAYARARGYEVVGMDHRSADPWMNGDICNQEQVWYAMRGCDYVLHLAAYSSMAGFDQEMWTNYRTNIQGFLNVMDAAYQRHIKKFVYASSSAVYLDGIGMQFREDEVLDVQRLHSHYGKSKLIDEMIADSYAFAYGFPVLGLRYFNVYGHGDEKKDTRCAPIQHFLNSATAGEPIVLYGDGEQAKDFIFVDDAIRITFDLMEGDAQGIYNVGTGKATSFNEAAALVGGEIQHAPNPLRTYQYRTQADTAKMLTAVGDQVFIPLQEGVKCLRPSPGVVKHPIPGATEAQVASEGPG